LNLDELMDSLEMQTTTHEWILEVSMDIVLFPLTGLLYTYMASLSSPLAFVHGVWSFSRLT
jgi:hypothetical protein